MEAYLTPRQRLLPADTLNDFLAVADPRTRVAIADQFDLALQHVNSAIADPSQIDAAVTQLTTLRATIERSGFPHYLQYLGDRLNDLANTGCQTRNFALQALSSDLAQVGTELREAHELGHVPPRGTRWVQHVATDDMPDPTPGRR